MKEIKEIISDLEALQPKFDIGASDWSKAEKGHIEACFYAITKETVGFGRTVDLGCSECVQTAVNVIKNYQAIIAREKILMGEMPEPTKSSSKVATAKKSKAKVAVEPEEDLESEEDSDEEDLDSEEDSEEDSDEDFLGENPVYSKQQLADIIKAKTGDSINADEFSVEQLMNTIKEIEDGQEQ